METYFEQPNLLDDINAIEFITISSARHLKLNQIIIESFREDHPKDRTIIL